ncbi:MAG: hypothetical protein R3F17_12010 [Planctomycetota bacterium]
MIRTVLSLAVLFACCSCGVTRLGQPYHQASLGTAPLIEQIEVREMLPMVGRAETVTATHQAADLQPERQIWPDDWTSLLTPPAATEFVLDLGVGEAPFDDACELFCLDPGPVRGFSDALVQIEVRRTWVGPVSWHGIAALSRIQEDTLLEAMQAGDWAWIGFGVQYSW